MGHMEDIYKQKDIQSKAEEAKKQKSLEERGKQQENKIVSEIIPALLSHALQFPNNFYRLIAVDSTEYISWELVHADIDTIPPQPSVNLLSNGHLAAMKPDNVWGCTPISYKYYRNFLSLAFYSFNMPSDIINNWIDTFFDRSSREVGLLCQAIESRDFNEAYERKNKPRKSFLSRILG